MPQRSSILPVQDTADGANLRPATGLRDLLNAVEDAPPGEVVDVVARQLLRSVGATEVGFLIADLSGDRLMPLTRVSAEPPRTATDLKDAVPIDDSPAGTALLSQRTQVVDGDGTVCVYAPVTARGDAIGVLDVTLPGQPAQAVIDEVNAMAHALAYIVNTNRRYTDLYEFRQRGSSVALAAEIQRRVIPDSFTCEAGWFTVAGWLEPSTEVAGDTFDFSFDESNLSLFLTDGMGHSVNSALLASVAVAALRNSRQAGCDLAEQASAASEALFNYSGEEEFVTGILVNIPLSGGLATILNAGHPAPFLVRDGQVRELSTVANLPFGVLRGVTYQSQPLELQIGDRLILVTDGMIERNVDADFDIKAAILALQGTHARQLVRQLCRDVTAVVAGGGPLQDDATVLCFDWHGEPGLARHSTSGSNDVVSL